MTLRCFCRKIVNQFVHLKYYSSQNHQCITTAGIIGDEILKGAVEDINSTFLAKQLHKLGLKLMKISVVADDVKEVSKEVKHFASSYDYVLTTGGIGPTHDDLTYEAVAHAFDEPLFLHPQLREICSNFYKTQDPLAAGMKLAYVPRSSRLHFLTTSGKKLSFPNVAVRNVYMFPGVPELLKKTILEAGPLLFYTDSKFFTKSVYCNIPEHEIINEIKQVVEEFPQVHFGCYPKFFNSVYKVKVTIESCNEESTKEAFARLMHLIPPESVVNKIDDI